jgi:hypothetical protein
MSDYDARFLMRQASDVPEYEQMMTYLKERRAVPLIKTDPYLTRSEGEFEVNAWGSTKLPEAGQITLNRYTKPQVLVHEVAHAASREMDKQYKEYNKDRFGKLFSLFPSDPTQFQAAYEKLVYNEQKLMDKSARTPIETFVKKLAPDFYNSNAEYRTTRRELQAYGVETATSSQFEDTLKYPFKSPPHIDPTLATEFLTLLNLAIKDQKKNNPPVPAPF